MTVDFDPLDLVDPDRYAARGYPHDLWTRLRREDPVAYVEAPGFEPFWAVTTHSDVLWVSARPTQFSNARGITLTRAGAAPIPASEILVLLDPPKHGTMRRIVIPRFTPRAVRTKRTELDELARDVVAEALGDGSSPELDVVDRIAAPFPLALIAWIVGVPRDDWRFLYGLSNEVIGKDDPEFRRPGESPGRTIQRARSEIRAYFADLLDQRRRDPQDDLASDLLQARVDAEPLTQEQLLSFCELFVEAGNETTRNAISGGVLAFCDHPGEWERLRACPELLPDAVDEILRWVSPISHFTRVATEDVTLHGRSIRAGDQLALYYGSANRDEAVFDDPFAFRIDRRPNPHLAFGFGEHFCVGSHLARVEIELVFGHLLRRVERFEAAGPVVRLRSAVNGSIKQLPIRLVIADGTPERGI